MAAIGASADINFKFGGRMANTLPAHRILQHFQESDGESVANAIVNGLYARYFEQERDPASEETLVGACVDAGIDERRAKEVVGDEYDGMAEVKSLIRQQGVDGVDAVPMVVLEGRKRDLTLIGAKEVEEYVKALETIIKESM
jgi:predicted DsbA family dithiol-disulfide isomerase